MKDISETSKKFCTTVLTYKLAFSMFSLKTLFCCGKIEPVSSKVNSVVSHCFSTGSFSSSLSAPFALQSHTQLLCVLIYIFLKIFLLRHRQNNPPLPKKKIMKMETNYKPSTNQGTALSKLQTKHKAPLFNCDWMKTYVKTT